jgi:hypothetical protein
MTFKYSVVLVSFLPLLLAGCQNDYQRSLPNGYRLVRTNAYTIAIFPPKGQYLDYFQEGIAVPPKIVEYGVDHAIVFGRIELAPLSELDYMSTPGYFILDTRTPSVKLGMGIAEWTEVLKTYGITTIKMKTP